MHIDTTNLPPPRPAEWHRDSKPVRKAMCRPGTLPDPQMRVTAIDHGQPPEALSVHAVEFPAADPCSGLEVPMGIGGQ